MFEQKRLDQLAWDISGAADLTVAARSMFDVGSMIGLPAPTYVSDVLTDLPVEDKRGRRFTETALGWNPSMLDWWYGERVGLRHPDVRRCLREHLPFLSSVYGVSTTRLRPEMRDVRDRMADYGLRSQLVIPVHLAGGVTALVGWSSSDERAAAKLPEEVRLALMGCAYAFADAVARLRPASPGQGTLTGRQRECVRLAASGMTAKQAALHLGLSPDTVRGHIKDASRRLHARSKSHLVSLAQNHGELSTPFGGVEGT